MPDLTMRHKNQARYWQAHKAHTAHHDNGRCTRRTKLTRSHSKDVGWNSSGGAGSINCSFAISVAIALNTQQCVTLRYLNCMVTHLHSAVYSDTPLVMSTCPTLINQPTLNHTALHRPTLSKHYSVPSRAGTPIALHHKTREVDPTIQTTPPAAPTNHSATAHSVTGLHLLRHHRPVDPTLQFTHLVL